MMEEKIVVEYPALVYQSKRNNNYIANCVMYNLISFGKTENDAVSSLQEIMQNELSDYEIIIKPLYKMGLSPT